MGKFFRLSAIRATSQDFFKISSYVKGDTAWIVGEWEGGRPHRFSGEFVIDIPRDTALLKIETGGGGVEATGITGALEH